MQRLCVVSLLFLTLTGTPALSDDPKPAKVTVVLSNVVNDGYAEVLRETLAAVPGIKAETDNIAAGQGRNLFTNLVLVEIADLEKTDLGALAKVVAGAKTPPTADRRPRLNLILFSPTQKVDEPTVAALREAVADVPGVDARAVGGTGGMPDAGTYWIRLDGTGAACLADALAAVKKADLDLQVEQR